MKKIWSRIVMSSPDHAARHVATICLFQNHGVPMLWAERAVNERPPRENESCDGLIQYIQNRAFVLRYGHEPQRADGLDFARSLMRPMDAE